jgi:hypothetical protein
VTFLFGGHTPREDPTLAEAARRQREAFARDIGDEHTLAWSRQRPAGPHRRRWSLLIFVVLLLFAGIGAIPLLRADAGGIVRRQCAQPAVGVSADQVPPGHQAAWQVAGPTTAPYVLALDTDRVTVTAAGTVTAPAGRVLAGPLTLADCRSPQTLFDVPAEAGKHQVILFRRTATGYAAVAQAVLTVG